MNVEIWTDIICPWCGIGKHNFERALAQFEHKDEVTVVHRSFQLDPRFPEDVVEPARDMLRTKYGANAAQVDAMQGRVEQMAAQAGIQPYHVSDNDVGNTSRAHELAAWATEQGKEAAIWDALFTRYFTERRSVFDVDALVDVAVSVGLDGAAAREALTSRRYRTQVQRDGREAHELGASGVPFVVMDRRLAVPGAQPPDVFLSALRQAWAAREESVTN